MGFEFGTKREIKHVSLLVTNTKKKEKITIHQFGENQKPCPSNSPFSQLFNDL